MNKEKLDKLQQQVRVGGKGVPRRKKKVLHKTATTDDRKLQNSLKRMSVNSISGIEEVNMIKDDGTVIHLNNPKVQAALQSNTFAVSGHAETRQITDMLPNILNQLGTDNMTHFKNLASSVQASVRASTQNEQDDDDDVPELVGNFDEASKQESSAVKEKATANTASAATAAVNKKDD